MNATAAIPPVAAPRPTTDSRHGETRTDDYFWLREKGTPEVTAYLEAENAYTAAVLQPTETLQSALYDEMLARIQETDLSVPYRQGGWRYYARTTEGKQYPIYCRIKDAPDADEEITLDLNLLAEGKAFLSLGAYAVSDDGTLLAYSTDETGFREYTLRIKDLRTGELLPDVIEKVGSVVWAGDNATLFYTTEDAAKRPYRVLRHLRQSPVEDSVVYEEPDALFRAFAYRSRDRQYLFVGSASSTATEIHFLRSDRPQDDLTRIAPRDPEAEHEYYVDHRDGLFYIRTNRGAVNFRLVTAPTATPSEENWAELIAHRPDVMLEDHDLFARHLVVTEREGGLPRLFVRSLKTGDDHAIPFPEPTYSVSGDINREFDTDTFRFRYQSLITPLSVFDYDLNTRARTLLKETPVLGPYDRTQYVSEFRHATASDGTKIPLSLVRKKGVAEDGQPAPCLLYGYGSYGISMPAGFSANRLSLLDRGIVFAIAHIRGGGELGKPWHDAGKMMAKKTTFTDFIACAEYLVEERITTSDRLAIMGGSAGGLLMGAVVNARPELFRSVVSVVPFVDVINTMLDDTLPLTVGEYLEWGNPHEEPAYRYMLSYSPYDNLERKAYPAMLVRTSLNDSQVMYWEPAKYVARLRTLKTDPSPLLFHINLAAGHGGSSGRYDALRETALDYAFLLATLGVTD
ncbi:MAG: S9 family peptidase [Cytophagales bacterium]|nr:S9 family peptidase [Armatimonadota bacterium]